MKESTYWAIFTAVTWIMAILLAFLSVTLTGGLAAVIATAVLILDGLLLIAFSYGYDSAKQDERREQRERTAAERAKKVEADARQRASITFDRYAGGGDRE